MSRLRELIRNNRAQYRQFKTRVDDVADIVSAILITLGILAFSMSACILGGAHG